jgi:RND superfamily putative drug exporter
MHSAQPDANMLPPNLKASKAFDKMLTAFPAGNTMVPAQVMVKSDELGSPSGIKAIDDLKRQALASGQFTTPIEVDTSPNGNIALVSMPTVGGGNNEDSRAKAAVNHLRDTIVPATVGRLAGADVGVTGGPASNEDFDAQFRNSAPLVFAFVLGFAFILLLVTFRSIVIALKAIVLNLLSVGAAYGVLVMVFQHGWGKQLLGFEYTGGIFGFLPIFLFVILFGLSMDYHVFIISRIREAHDRGMSNEEAVGQGIRSTAGVVTSAALVMVGVFTIFASLQFIFLKQFGVGLAVAIFLDATLVRAVLLPATMKLLGDANWYLPGWLGWLPRLDHSTEPSHTGVPAFDRAR